MTTKNLTVKEIIQECNGELVNGLEDTSITTYSIDTRQITQGDMYIAIKGENFDGNVFFEHALEKGAMGCIIEEIEISKEIIEKYADKIIIKVEDTKKALRNIAACKREKYQIPVIGITGSVGKTSTKDVIASVLSKRYHVLKTQGNQNNNIGLCLTILRLQEHDCLVIEMGMNNLGEISYLAKIAKPTIAVITNIGTAHIGNLGSRENILKAKLEILEGLRLGGTLVINNDNDLLHIWKNKNEEQYPLVTYGKENKSDYMAYNIECTQVGSTYQTQVGEQQYTVEVPISGEPFVYNSLCAISIGRIFDIPMQEILQGIKEFELTKKRMDVHKISNDITVINDSYNASYDSVKPALKYLGIMQGKRKIAVLGDMLELGDYTQELHEKIAKDIIENKIDILVTVGEFSKYTAQKAKRLFMEEENIYTCHTTQEAIEVLGTILQQGDVMLLKASNSMHFSNILEGLK